MWAPKTGKLTFSKRKKLAEGFFLCIQVAGRLGYEDHILYVNMNSMGSTSQPSCQNVHMEISSGTPYVKVGSNDENNSWIKPSVLLYLCLKVIKMN